LGRLVGSINRYLGEESGSDAGAQVGAEPGEGLGGGLAITGSRPAGGARPLDGLWQQVGDRHRAARGARRTPVRNRHRAGGLRPTACLLSRQPHGDGALDDGSSVDGGELVVAGGDAAPLLVVSDERSMTLRPL
jgi:hypothetical protein